MPSLSALNDLHGWFGEHVDFGDVPTWLAVAAVYFACRSWRSHSQAVERGQADKLAVWSETLFNEHPAKDYYPEHYFLSVYALRNASELPVYEATVYSYVNDQPSALWLVQSGTLPPRTEPLLVVDNSDHEDAAGIEYAIEFVDASGQRWHRDRQGRLLEGPMPGVEKFKSLSFDDSNIVVSLAFRARAGLLSA